MKYQKTFCSQCGNAFGAGDAGFSSCAEHTKGNKDILFSLWYDSLEGTKSQGFAYKAWSAGWDAANQEKHYSLDAILERVNTQETGDN
jgi:hypothetical protein